MSLKWPTKDPDEVLDYSIDWSRFLKGTPISSVRWYVYDRNNVKTELVVGQDVDGISATAATTSATVATIVLSGGTLNKEYKIGCAITFGASLVTERTVSLRIRQN